MTDNQFMTWLKKIDKANLNPHYAFSLHTILTSIKYLQEKNFTVNDFDKVFDDFVKQDKNRGA